MAAPELKTEGDGVQSLLTTTRRNCGGTAGAERNVRPHVFLTKRKTFVDYRMKYPFYFSSVTYKGHTMDTTSGNRPFYSSVKCNQTFV